MRRSTLVTTIMIATLLLAAPALAFHTGKDNSISGQVITRDDGQPQAGVWVIAESWDLMPNDGRLLDRFRKIVVTDDDGNFALPDLPEADYNIWVRGYGLVDSKPSHNVPGHLWARPGAVDVVVEVERAETRQQAAQVFPANYWMSMMQLPSDEHFPGDGTYIGAGMSTRDDFVGNFQLNCQLCHQVGTYATRLYYRESYDIGFKKAARMDGTTYVMGREAMLDMMGDWGKRILDGEVPSQTPRRPEGIERNVVITSWEFGDIYAYVHDTVSHDWNNALSNPYGRVYGTDIANDWLYILDPMENRWWRERIPNFMIQNLKGYSSLGDPTPDGNTTFKGAVDYSAAYAHTPTMDAEGIVWLATQSSGDYRPDFCPEDVNTPRGSITAYYPEEDDFVVVPTCFSTHHITVAEDGTIWVNGDTRYIGWFDPSKFDRADLATSEEAQDWEHIVVDLDGDGVADTPLVGFTYSVAHNPVDGSVWYGVLEANPGRILRFDRETRHFEAFSPPIGSGHFGTRGVWVDSKGLVWVPMSGSGHLARFDRSQCEQTWGTGQQCPEGWTFWEVPGPHFEGTDGNTNFFYFVWVDRYNATGLGHDTVLLTGTNTDAIIAFNQQTEEFTFLRVPYPLGLFTRFMDARVDDPDAGWKGRGIWTAYQTTTALHTETRRPSFLHIQIRPNPLAH